MNNKTLFVILLSFSISLFTFSQENDSIQIKHQVFFNKISDRGGVWVAENPKYDASNSDDFKVFILKSILVDELKIDADIYGVNTKNDTIGFWKFSEFYAPDKKKNLFYQRSWNGQYYATGFATMTETERFCEMSFFYVGGEYLKHKDTHTFVDTDTMISISYDYDPKSDKWINKSELTWKRKV